MSRKSLFITYQNLRGKSPQGQVAILFIVLIAMVFIFMAITINVGRVAKTKTQLDNAVDGAVLLGASIIASYGYALDRQTFCYDWWDYGFLGKVVGFIVAAVLFVAGFFTGGASWVAAISTLSGGYLVATHEAPGLLDDFGFEGLDLTNQVMQGAIAYALESIVDDADMTTDGYDLDHDGYNTDEIPEFKEWWHRRLASLERNLLTSMDEWICFDRGYSPDDEGIIADECPYIDSGQWPVEGPLTYFTEQIDGGFDFYKLQFNEESGELEVVDEDGDGNPDIDYTGLGNSSNDYRLYLRDEFIPLLSHLMVRYYLAFDRDRDGELVDEGRFKYYLADNKPSNIKTQIHLDITPKLVDCNRRCCHIDFGSGQDCCLIEGEEWCCGSVEQCCITDKCCIPELYEELDGMWREGDCDTPELWNAFNGCLPDSEACDPVDEILFQFDDFLRFTNDLNYLENTEKEQDKVLTLLYLDPAEIECKTETFHSESTSLGVSLDKCTTSWYQKLGEWQDEIRHSWRGRLSEVLWTFDVGLRECKRDCTTRICPNIAVVHSKPDDINAACDTLVGNFSVAEQIFSNNQYDLNIESCCKQGGGCYSAGGNSSCQDPKTGRLDWPCYSDCYNEQYWSAYPYDENNWLRNWCIGQRDTNGDGVSDEYYSPGWEGNEADCNSICGLICDGLYDLEEGLSGLADVYFQERITQVLQRLGAPHSYIPDTLYWAIDDFRNALQTFYQTVTPKLEKYDPRATYAWKDEDGWHLAMAEVSSKFAMPYLEKHQWKTGSIFKHHHECLELEYEPGPKEVDVWVWRYDQGKELEFAGKGKIPWWTFRYGRKADASENEPAFMSASGIENWKDLDLLDPSSSYKDEIECFLCKYGQRAHAKAEFAEHINKINIVDTSWINSEFCLACP